MRTAGLLLLGCCALAAAAFLALRSDRAAFAVAVTAAAHVDGTSASAVQAAALRIFNGVPEDDCQSNNPQGKQCVGMPSVDSAARGIATVGVGDPSGGGFQAVLGTDTSGNWQFWFGTQNVVYQLLDLPGQVVVCAGGDSLNVRSSADTSASVVGSLPDRSTATAEQFVLTQPAQLSQNGPPTSGSGWYRLSAPVQGWASSHYLASATTDPNCQIHDAQAGS